MAATVTSENLAEVTKDGLTIVDFWAPWCGPCKMMEPILENLEQSYGDQVHFGKLNVYPEAKLAKYIEKKINENESK